MGHYISYIFTIRKPITQSDREVLCNILIEFGIPVELVRLIKMYVNETYGKVHKGKNLSDTFSSHNLLKQDVLSPLFFL
jgi:hypothetical protein